MMRRGRVCDIKIITKFVEICAKIDAKASGSVQKLMHLAGQQGLPEGEKPTVPGDKAELMTDEGCIMQQFAE